MPLTARLPGRSSLAALTALAGAGVLVQGGARFLYTTLVIRMTSTDVVADVGESLALASFVALLWPTAAGNTAARFLAAAAGRRDDEEARWVALHLARITVVSGIVLAALAAAYSVVALRQTPLQTLSVVALVLSLTGYYLTKGVRYGHGRVAQATMWEVLAAGTSLTTVVLVLAAGLDGIAALPLAMGYAVFTVANWPWGRPSRSQRPALARRLRSFALWGVIGTLAAGALLPLSQVLVRHWSDRADVAVYAAAMFLATPASMLAGALAQVLFPAVARTSAGGRTDQVRQQIDLATRGLVVALVGALGAVILLAPVLLRLLYGPDYVAGRDVLSVLALAVLFTSASSGCVAGLIGGRDSGMRLVATTQAAGTLTGLLVIVVASPSLGPLGSAVGVLVGSAVNGLVPLAVVWREHHMGWSSVMLRAVLGLSLMGGAYVWLGARPLSVIACAVVTAAWLLAWLALSLPDVRRLLPRS